MPEWLSNVVATLKAWFRRSTDVAEFPDADTPEWAALTERARTDMEARRRALAPLAGVVGDISAALYEVDPIDLSDGGSEDEYDSEAETIVLRLSDRRELLSEEEVLVIVHEEFQRWFGEDLAGPREEYEAVASEVHRLWGEYLAKGL